jgi:hypothetical protein
MEKISESVVGAGITIRQYYRLLTDRLDTLETLRENIGSYEQEFRGASAQQIAKHRKYYHEILEIIENSMKQSETLITHSFNHGCEVLSGKYRKVEEEIAVVRGELEKLMEFQEKKIGGESTTEIQFDFGYTLREVATEIELPVLEIFTEIPDLVPSFLTVFTAKYAITPLSLEYSKLLHRP